MFLDKDWLWTDRHTDREANTGPLGLFEFLASAYDHRVVQFTVTYFSPMECIISRFYCIYLFFTLLLLATNCALEALTL